MTTGAVHLQAGATKGRIEAAAARLDQSASAFVVDAASVAADRVLARTETAVMPAEQSDAMLAALDVPDDAPALTRLVQRERKYHLSHDQPGVRTPGRAQ